MATIGPSQLIPTFLVGIEGISQLSRLFAPTIPCRPWLRSDLSLHPSQLPCSTPPALLFRLANRRSNPQPPRPSRSRKLMNKACSREPGTRHHENAGGTEPVGPGEAYPHQSDRTRWKATSDVRYSSPRTC